MARPKIPKELKKAHWRLYMANYRQKKKQEQFNKQLNESIYALSSPFAAGKR